MNLNKTILFIRIKGFYIYSFLVSIVFIGGFIFSLIFNDKLKLINLNYITSVIAPYFFSFYINDSYWGKLKIFNQKYFAVFPITKSEFIKKEIFFIFKLRKFKFFLLSIFFYLIYCIIAFQFNIFIIISTILLLCFLITFTVLFKNFFVFEKGIETLALIHVFTNLFIFIPIILEGMICNTIGLDCISKYNPFSGLFLTLFMYEWKEKIVASFILIFSLWITFLLYNKCQKEWRI